MSHEPDPNQPNASEPASESPDFTPESVFAATDEDLAEQEAEHEIDRERLRLVANKLAAEANAAALAATSAINYARDLGWLHTYNSVDALLCQAVSDALAKLPDDATPLQIERAKMTAIAVTKREMIDGLASEAMDAEREALALVLDFRAKEAEAKKAIAKLDAKDMPMWAVAGMAGLLGGFMLSGFGKAEK